MRTITLVALVYLPASFTATFLAMGYVHVESLPGPGVSRVMKMKVEPEMWFYLAITLPLMATTFLAWGVWEWWFRKRIRAKLGELKDPEVGDAGLEDPNTKVKVG